MQVASIIKARAVALIEVDELNRNGKVRFSEIIKPLIEEFNFEKYPAAEIDPEKGVTFESGRLGEIVLSALTIFPGLITLESLSNTRDSKLALEHVLMWAEKNLGLTYSPGMIKRWGYISQIVFYSNYPLLRLISVPLNNLAKKTTGVVDGLFREGLEYELSKIVIGHDPLTRQGSIAGVTLEHRANVKFEENKFFSEAPLPTDEHIHFLQELEDELTKAK